MANQLIDLRLRYRDSLESDKRELFRLINPMILKVFGFGLLFGISEVIVTLSLFLLLSVLFFRKQYQVCQADPLPAIHQLAFWLAQGLTLLTFMIPLYSKRISIQSKLRIVNVFIGFSGLFALTLTVLFSTDTLCLLYLFNLLWVFLFLIVTVLLLVPCIIYLERRNVNKLYKHALDGLADSEERPEHVKQKRRVKKRKAVDEGQTEETMYTDEQSLITV